MWREIYPKALGNRNPRAISIIDSTRFKTPSVDLPLVPLVRWMVVGDRPPPRARAFARSLARSLARAPLPDPPVCCAVLFILRSLTDATIVTLGICGPRRCHSRFVRLDGQLCRHLPCFFRDVHLGELPLDHSPDNMPHHRDESWRERNDTISNIALLLEKEKDFIFD
jgi:hypothetical protein